MVVEAVVVGGTAEVVVVVVVVEVAGVLGISDISGTEEVVVEVVGVLGVSDASDGKEEAEEVVGVDAVDAGDPVPAGPVPSVPRAADPAKVVAGVSGGAEAAEVATASAPVAVGPGLLSSPSEEQAAPTSPKTAAIATASTNFVCFIAENLSSDNSGFIFYHTSIEAYSDVSLSGRAKAMAALKQRVAILELRYRFLMRELEARLCRLRRAL